MKTTKTEIKNIISETLDEIDSQLAETWWGPENLPKKPERKPWRESPAFEGKIEAAVEKLWSNFHGDQHPDQPLRVATERIEMWQEIMKQLEQKASEKE
tara:strand:- start:1421 stop:1717 length:297 start_codon:yes stop_codon:yes gene_type:complete